MKLRQLMLSLITCVTLYPSFSHARAISEKYPIENGTPLLEKKTTPGFAPVEDQFFISCQIFHDAVIVTKGVGNLYSKTIQPHTLYGELLSLIAAASKSAVTTSSMPVDLPTTSYSAYLPQHQENPEIKLFARVYQGDTIYRNHSSAAMQLVNFLDVNCDF